jgi:hypothetical protein
MRVSFLYRMFYYVFDCELVLRVSYQKVIFSGKDELLSAPVKRASRLVMTPVVRRFQQSSEFSLTQMQSELRPQLFKQ